MAKPKISDFFRGDTLDYLIEFIDGTSPIDISGWEIYLTLKISPQDADSKAALQLKYTIENSTLAESGRAYLYVKSQYTNGLKAGQRYFWDIQVIKPDSVVETVASGVVFCIRDITQITWTPGSR